MEETLENEKNNEFEETENSIEVEIFNKLDSNLSKKEIHQIFMVYNECFYHNKVTKTKQVKLAKDWLSKYKTWHWFFAKVKGQIVGIAAYCYNYQHVDKFDLREDRGENICSVGVLQKFRQLGIARLLMNSIIENYGSKNDLVVEIKKANKYGSILDRFYRDLNFQELSNDTQGTFLILYQSIN